MCHKDRGVGEERREEGVRPGLVVDRKYPVFYTRYRVDFYSE